MVILILSSTKRPINVRYCRAQTNCRLLEYKIVSKNTDKRRARQSCKIPKLFMLVILRQQHLLSSILFRVEITLFYELAVCIPMKCSMGTDTKQVSV